MTHTFRCHLGQDRRGPRQSLCLASPHGSKGDEGQGLVQAEGRAHEGFEEGSKVEGRAHEEQGQGQIEVDLLTQEPRPVGLQRLALQAQSDGQEGVALPFEGLQELSFVAEKREFQSKLELVPDLCWLVAEEKEYISTTESQDKLSGPMCLWDVARVNGVAWDPSNKAVVDFVKSLVAGCEEVQPEDENMLDQGHKQYIYQKTMEKKRHPRQRANAGSHQAGED